MKTICTGKFNKSFKIAFSTDEGLLMKVQMKLLQKLSVQVSPIKKRGKKKIQGSFLKLKHFIKFA